MISAMPFAGVERRVAFLRGTLLVSLFLGMLASAPVWQNVRSYPLLPVAAWVPILPAPADVALFAAMLFALVAAGWRYRAAVVFFLVAAVFAWTQDQHRGQPWFYMYCAMLLLSLFRTETALAACRVALTAVYFWGGVQKCNARYFELMPGWFVEPMGHWPVPDLAVTAMRSAIWAAPFVEIAFAVGLWIPQARRLTLVGITLLHGFALLLLGPLGHDYNWVVWPWNLAMIALAWTLFAAPGCSSAEAGASVKLTSDNPAARAPLTISGAVAALRRSSVALVFTGLFALLPALSFIGRWDSSFSFALYSESQAVANVFVTPAFAERLPPPLRRYLRPYDVAFDPQHQGPLLFEFQRWCYDDLRVPAFAEPRGYRGMFQHLQTYAPTPPDLRMIIGPRAGPVIFLEGDREQSLERK